MILSTTIPTGPFSKLSLLGLLLPWKKRSPCLLPSSQRTVGQTVLDAATYLATGLTIPGLERRETLPEDVTETDFNAYIAAANNAISPYDLEIRSTYHQTSRTRVYALVNSTSDPLSQIATPYSVEEIAFLKRVLDAMFETYNTRRHEIMAITSMQAVRLHKPSAENRRETQNASESQGAAAQGISMTQAEKMLKTLVDEGWLEKSRKGFYSLSPRALMELRGWLMETYNDVEDDDEDARTLNIKLCYACKEIITVVSDGKMFVAHFVVC